MEKHITIEQCKDGYLYFISARNASLGIYGETKKGFLISREKFGSIYPFTEYHYDTGAPFGTVHPIEELEKAPDFGCSLKEIENSILVGYPYKECCEKFLQYMKEARIRFDIKFKQAIRFLDKARADTYTDRFILSSCYEDEELFKKVKIWLKG